MKYLFGKDIGQTGPEHDGVDGVYGSATKPVVAEVLEEIGLSGTLTTGAVWREFLLECRKGPSFNPAKPPGGEAGPPAGL